MKPCDFEQIETVCQGRGESEAAGKAARHMAPPPPPQVILFCILAWDACHVAGTTCNDRRWMGARDAAPKNLHLTVPKSGSNAAQQYVDGFAFFHVHCSTKSQENPKGPKILNSQISYQKKSVYVPLQHDCSKNALLFTISWAQRHLGLCVNVY